MQSCHSRRPPIAQVTLDGFINGIGKLTERKCLCRDSATLRIVPGSGKPAGFLVSLNCENQFHFVRAINLKHQSELYNRWR